jgi:hypothetical protein
VRKREYNLRAEQRQASSQLFGLLPPESDATQNQQSDPLSASATFPSSSAPQQYDAAGGGATAAMAPSDWTIYDADFFALPWSHESDQGLQDFLQPGTYTIDGASVADIPLFPMYDQHTAGGFF